MKFDILFAGVGGQGVLSMAAVIGRAAVSEGLRAKQSEVHGMAQRGGAVQAHLRISDDLVESDLIPLGAADLILSLEPVEALRYLAWLSPEGALITTSNPYVNINDYPDLEPLLARIRSLPHSVVVDGEKLATEAGDVQAVNTVMVGAAAHVLPLAPESLEDAVAAMFARKGAAAVAMNRRAFHLGREAAEAEVASR
jgi:indolepyruvate ferredoxin oxidoreductase, beta subunit